MVALVRTIGIVWSVWASLVLAESPRAAAAFVSGCDERAAITYVAHPWHDHVGSYADGDIQVVILDRVEPAASAVYVGVLSPPFDHFGLPKCHLIGRSERLGFADAKLPERVAIDARHQIMLHLPVAYYDPLAPDSKRWQLQEISLDPLMGRLQIKTLSSH